jgi:K+-sensing histidine kinase KdpD
MIRSPLGPRLPVAAGAAAALVAVSATTALVYPLKGVAPVESLSVVYLLAVLAISIVWGAPLGVATAVASAMAFNFFHLPPTGGFTIDEPENWVGLLVFLVAAVLASSVAEAARRRTLEADERRREADLSSEMARLLVRGQRIGDSAPAAAQRLAQALGLSSAAIELRAVEADERRLAFPLREGTRQIGTLVLPVGLPESALRRIQERVAPPLEALLAAGLEREGLLESAIETAALRRSDVVKTALLSRSPELCLIDELAHSNVPGVEHAKRYEDIAAVLDAGIDVFSTVNVQHLESVNDLVTELTGVRIRETVPDAVLATADEVVLIDLTPEALIARLQAGKVYSHDRIQPTLNGFFKVEDLQALREVALREVAEDVEAKRLVRREPLGLREERLLGGTTEQQPIAGTRAPAPRVSSSITRAATTRPQTRRSWELIPSPRHDRRRLAPEEPCRCTVMPRRTPTTAWGSGPSSPCPVRPRRSRGCGFPRARCPRTPPRRSSATS